MRFAIITAALLVAASPAAVSAQDSFSLSLAANVPSDVFSGKRSKDVLAAQVHAKGDRGPARIRTGIAEGSTKVEMVDPQKAEGRLAELFERIKSRHGHPLVSSYYRALGASPDVLDSLWSRFEPRVGSEPYQARTREVIAAAEAHARSLPGLRVEPPTEHADQIRSLIRAFRCKFIPEMLVDVVAIKAMLDGPEAAARSPFSLCHCGE